MAGTNSPDPKTQIRQDKCISPGLHLHLHLVILQTLLSKATYNWEYIKRLILKRQTYRGSANNTTSQAYREVTDYLVFCPELELKAFQLERQSYPWTNPLRKDKNYTTLLVVLVSVFSALFPCFHGLRSAGASSFHGRANSKSCGELVSIRDFCEYFSTTNLLDTIPAPASLSLIFAKFSL